MANLKELRNRIASVRNTRKITAAMSQIAAARLKRAQDAVLAARPYGVRMRQMVEGLVAGIDPAERANAHPLMVQRKVRRVGLVVLTADRGLCGGFNSNVVRAVLRWLEEQKADGIEVEVTAIGKKAVAALKYARVPVVATHDAPTLQTLVPLSKTVGAAAMQSFMGKSEPRVDEVRMVSNEFVSVLTQRVRNDRVLPLGASEEALAQTGKREPKYEPNRAAILEHLVPVAIESQLQQAMFNSIAAEIAARRVAMDAATDNATDMIADLNLFYNRERQAAITKELMEIIGGAEALKT